MTYIRRKSQKQEKRTAKEFGGSVQIASGAIETMKGDVRTGYESTVGKFNESDFLIENKFTDSPAYSLKLATWEKIEKEAFRDNFRTPLMQIDVQDHIQVVVMNRDTFKTYFPDGKTMRKVNIATGKSFSLGKKSIDLFSHDCIALHFLKYNMVLFVMDKETFLSEIDK